MELKKYMSFKDNLIRNNFLLKFFVIVQTILIIYLVNVVIYKTDNQRTVFIPPQKTYKEFWVNGDDVSKSYLDMMSEFVSFNLLNLSEFNAKELLSNILPLVSSSNFYQVKAELQKMLNYIIENKINRIFYYKGTDIKKDKDGNRLLIVKGILKDSIGNEIISEKKVKLTIEYEIKFGKFFILNLVLEDD